jgi:hypothetical protein
LIGQQAKSMFIIITYCYNNNNNNNNHNNNYNNNNNNNNNTNKLSVADVRDKTKHDAPLSTTKLCTMNQEEKEN